MRIGPIEFKNYYEGPCPKGPITIGCQFIDYRGKKTFCGFYVRIAWKWKLKECPHALEFCYPVITLRLRRLPSWAKRRWKFAKTVIWHQLSKEDIHGNN